MSIVVECETKKKNREKRKERKSRERKGSQRVIKWPARHLFALSALFGIATRLEKPLGPAAKKAPSGPSSL